MREYYEIWWEQITGPKRFVDRIVKNINDDKCTVLCVPDILPWGAEFREVIIRSYINSEKWFEIIDVGIGDIADAGNYLLQKFAEDKTKNSYAYHSHNTAIEKYLKDNKVLNNRIIWIKNISETALSKWTAFLRKYISNDNSEGTFILETCNEFNKSEKINVLKYSDFVTIYDAHLFASIVASQSANEQLVHQYITNLADSLCGMNVEMMVNFINDTDFYEDDITGSFIKYSDASDVELKHKIWTAQIKIAFPLIEVARVNFVDKYSHLIQDCLPVEQFGEIIEDSYEVELGTLIYFLSSKYEEVKGNRLVTSYQDYEDLHFLHKIRNKLAHVKCCSSEELHTLLLNNFFTGGVRELNT